MPDPISTCLHETVTSESEFLSALESLPRDKVFSFTEACDFSRFADLAEQVLVIGLILSESTSVPRALLDRADFLVFSNHEQRRRVETAASLPLGHKALDAPALLDRVGMSRWRSGSHRDGGRAHFDVAGDRHVVVLEAGEAAAEVEAARVTAWKIAPHLPTADVFVSGNAGRFLGDDALPINVKCVGWLDFERRRQLLSAADLVVLPHDGEGVVPSPLVVEYLGGGIPVLAMRGALHPDIEASGAVEITDPDCFAACAAGILSDAGHLQRLRHAGVASAEILASPLRRYAELLAAIERRQKRRLIVLNDYQVNPVRQGGQVRVNAVCRALVAAGHRVTLVSMGDDPSGRYLPLGPNLEEVTIARGAGLKRLDRRFSSLAGANASDVATLAGAARRAPWASSFLRREFPRATGVLFSHPYMGGFLEAVPPTVPVYYDSHNTEWMLKRAIYTRRLGRWFLSRMVRRAEGALIRRASATFYVSQENRDDLSLFESGGTHLVCPNGVSVGGRVYIDPAERPERRSEVGLPSGPLALFLGSGHPPNAEAARLIINKIAPANPGVKFLLVGTVVGWFHGQALPANVVAWGTASADVKDFLLSHADIALNPMLTGSGTSLKMMDYMASGLPIITTEVGARGMVGRELEGTLVCPVDGFAAALADLAHDDARRRLLAQKARETAETCFDWGITLARMIDAVGHAGNV